MMEAFSSLAVKAESIPLIQNLVIIAVTIVVIIIMAILSVIFGARSITWRGIEDADYVYRKVLSEINLMRRLSQRVEDETEAD